MKRLIQKIRSAPYIEPLSDPEEIRSLYKHWRVRTLYSMMVGYAVYYFVRKNFSMAMPVFLSEMGYTKSDLGLILSLFSVLYGVGKLVNGVLADRLNARFFMVIGLMASAIVNLCFGLSSSLLAFGFFWLANAWFQSFGMPASVRLLTHWYSSTELGTIWGIQSTAHQIGGAVIVILAGFLVSSYGWQSAFIIPSAIAMFTSLWLAERLRDTPQSIGLPAIETHRGEANIDDPDEGYARSFREIFTTYILPNRTVWVLTIANVFVYIVRIGIMDWAPTFLVESRGSSLAGAGLKTAAFELAGMAGAVGFGWISDKLFMGRRGPLAVISMVLLGISITVLWMTPPGHGLLDTATLIIAGVMVYGAQLLVPVAAADAATKKAAATATGMTGASGYVGSAIAGLGTGVIADTWGWNGGIFFFMISAFIGAFLFLFIWNSRAPALERRAS